MTISYRRALLLSLLLLNLSAYVGVPFWTRCDVMGSMYARHVYDDAPNHDGARNGNGIDSTDDGNPWIGLWHSLNATAASSARDGSRTGSNVRSSVVSNALPRHSQQQQQQTPESAAGSVAMLTHCTPHKFPRLLLQIQRWGGPVSLALYITTLEQMLEFCSFAEINRDVLADTAIHLYIEFDEGKSLENEGYPFNLLRNVALDHAGDDVEYVLPMDVDFLTTRDCRVQLEEIVKVEAEVLRRRTVMVLPAFEVRLPQGTEEEDRQQWQRNGTNVAIGNMERLLPNSKAELMDMVKKGAAEPINLKRFKWGQLATDFEKWYAYDGGDDDNVNHDNYYWIPYDKFYEPYVLAYRPGLPKYYESFRGYGFDKSSWFLELHVRGYQYGVLKEPFVVHVAHGYGKRGLPRRKRVAFRSFKRYLIETVGANATFLDWLQI